MRMARSTGAVSGLLIALGGTGRRGALDRQQMLLLDTLRRAAGAPMSYAQLQEVGVEFPASVISELELAGVIIERQYANARGARRFVGVRLDPSCDSYRMLVRSTARGFKPISTLAAHSQRAIWVMRELGVGAAKRWLAPVALFAVAGLVAALMLLRLSGGGQAGHVAVHRHPLRQAAAAVVPSHPRSSETRSSIAAPPQHVSHPAPPTPMSATLAAQLDAQGHDLLGAGRYGDAIAVLRSALAATGERLQDCLRPASETCLIYAYALYDLGSALRLHGQPAAAVPVLRRRLLIDNQRPTVQAQLELALRRAS